MQACLDTDTLYIRRYLIRAVHLFQSRISCLGNIVAWRTKWLLPNDSVLWLLIIKYRRFSNSFFKTYVKVSTNSDWNTTFTWQELKTLRKMYEIGVYTYCTEKCTQKGKRKCSVWLLIYSQRWPQRSTVKHTKPVGIVKCFPEISLTP